MVKAPRIDPLLHRKWVQVPFYSSKTSQLLSLAPPQTASSANLLADHQHLPTHHQHLTQGNDLQSRTIRVMSFNMLNQSYLWPQIYNQYVSPLHQSRTYRLDLLQQTISALSSDIMCFQEMELKAYKEIWRNIPGFGSEYIRKGKPAYWEDKKDLDLIDGVSVFYDLNKFELIDKEMFNLNDVVKLNYLTGGDKDEHSWLDWSKVRSRFEKRNQVALILALRHKATNEIILVSNTHLYWKFNDIKLLQTILITKALTRWKIRYPFAKILFLGDLNSRPYSSVYNYLKFGISKSNQDVSPFLAKNFQGTVLKNPIHLNSNILQDEVMNDKLFTCFTKTLYGIFDYIWFDSEDFKLVQKLSGIDENYLKGKEGLPDGEYPSDHIPLVAEFVIRN
ncbi:hypothetical protein WICPIJ_002502 [Wickerhamomyces pijperi]|uniref:Endonuclease/exonuclease/phosphatase domain-containing protein n=1 Tax=Wickerhamomyces pijperi TaxID=599730 RepID=A0A9P8TPS7_WICPI|nr:hypothetical protein WICPIJ_002502 [Wickerhamomyces pijperi]